MNNLSDLTSLIFDQRLLKVFNGLNSVDSIVTKDNFKIYIY